MNFYTSKKDFIAFRKAFAAAQNDQRAHKTIDEVGTKNPGWINCSHFLLYNLIAGRHFYLGFSPKLKESYLNSGGDPNRGIVGAVNYLDYVIKAAKTLIDPNSINIPSWYSKNPEDKQRFIERELKQKQSTVDKFLEPFQGAFTVVDLARVVLPPHDIGRPLVPFSVEELQQKKTYWSVFGPNVIDQTPLSAEIKTEEKPKSFLGCIFGD